MGLDSRGVRADLLLLVTALIWGAAFVAQRVGMEHVGPMTFNGVRFALGGLALTPLIWRGGRMGDGAGAMVHGATGWTYVWAGALAGAALFAGATLQQVGIVYTTAGKAGFITGLYVVIVPLLGLPLGHRPGWGTWAGAVLAAVGLYFLSVTEEFTIAYGDMLELIGAVFWSVHVLLIGRLSPRMDPVRLAQAQFLACSVLSLAAAACTESVTLEGLRGAAVPILYGGLLSVGVAYTLQVVAQRDAKPAHASIILSLESLFAAVAGWAILDETLGLRALAGCGLMLAGMLISQLRP
jgi:drug/metabolite transporter (DMT)-like permease